MDAACPSQTTIVECINFACTEKYSVVQAPNVGNIFFAQLSLYFSPKVVKDYAKNSYVFLLYLNKSVLSFNLIHEMDFSVFCTMV